MHITRDWRKWNPRSYLSQYYMTPTIPSDELSILRHILPFLRSRTHPFSKAIDVGAGPTLHHAIALIPYVAELHLSDYLTNNLKHIRKWLDSAPDAHNWDTYIKEIILLENTKETLNERKALLREKITLLTKIDLKKQHPLASREKYPLVTSFYCADSIAQTKSQWRSYMRHLFQLVAPGGAIILSALHHAQQYIVGVHAFPSANITQGDLVDIFTQNNFRRNRLDIHEAPVSEPV